MPRVTNGYGEMEFIITPDTTYILVDHILDDRRIFTDGRDWPKEMEPTFLGYSIGKWIDTKNTGHYDVLEVETRGFKGPRAFDASGIPLHKDNQTIVQERIYLDATNRNVAHDGDAVIWTTAQYPPVDVGPELHSRSPNPYPTGRGILRGQSPRLGEQGHHYYWRRGYTVPRGRTFRGRRIYAFFQKAKNGTGRPSGHGGIDPASKTCNIWPRKETC